jgi:hypothetical protein
MKLKMHGVKELAISNTQEQMLEHGLWKHPS